MDGSTALAVLGLEPGATKQQIKTTFRALVKGAHPDAFGVDVDDADLTEVFVTLRTAYEQALHDAPDGSLLLTHPSAAVGSVETSTVMAGAMMTSSMVTSAMVTSAMVTSAMVAGAMADSRPIDSRPVVAPSFEARRPIVPSHDRGNWFTSAGSAGHVDVTDVSVVGARALRADVVDRSRRSMDSTEQLFASFLADELAAA